MEFQGYFNVYLKEISVFLRVPVMTLLDDGSFKSWFLFENFFFKIHCNQAIIQIFPGQKCNKKAFWIIMALKKNQNQNTCLFYKQCFFSTQPQCYLTLSWIQLQMLPKCWLVHMSIIIVRRFLYLLYLCPYLDLGLFMLYLSDLFLFSSPFS